MQNYWKAWGVWMLLALLPTLGFASESNQSLFAYRAVVMAGPDSTVYRMQQDDQEPKRKRGKHSDDKPEADRDKERRPEPKVADLEPRRPNIKEVPRARPKLRPGVVDRVKVKRPPVRVKPGRVLRTIGL